MVKAGSTARGGAQAVKSAWLWNGVIAAAAPGVAASEPMQCEGNTSQGTVPLDCLGRVFRAARQKPAGGRQQWRDEQLISANRSLQHQAQHPRTIRPFHLTTPAGRARPTHRYADVDAGAATPWPHLRGG